MGNSPSIEISVEQQCLGRRSSSSKGLPRIFLETYSSGVGMFQRIFQSVHQRRNNGDSPVNSSNGESCVNFRYGEGPVEYSNGESRVRYRNGECPGTFSSRTEEKTGWLQREGLPLTGGPGVDANGRRRGTSCR